MVFVGDGGDKLQVARAPDSAAILLYRIREPNGGAENADLIASRSVKTEKLVDLRGHDYRLEPNARITPDNNWVIFRSNMFGTPSVFAVEVKKGAAKTDEMQSTFELSKKMRARHRQTLMLDPA